MCDTLIESGDISLDELYWHAEEFCQKWWSVPFTGKIELVNRYWRTRYGAFWFKRDGSDCLIRMSRKVNAGRTKDEVLRTLLHELVHWRMFTTGQPFDDADDAFIRECLRVGASISGTKAAQEAYKRYIENNENTDEGENE